MPHATTTDAVDYVRQFLAGAKGAEEHPNHHELVPLLAEYDRRGAELKRLRRVDRLARRVIVSGLTGGQDVALGRLSLALDGDPDADPDSVELERLRARVAELEAIESRADETSTWCGDNLMHRAVRYIRTGRTGDFGEVSS